MNTNKWLFSRPIDILVLGLPVWLSWVVCFLLPEETIHQQSLPLWVWAIFILGIDVSHVWSTIFRTYLDREEFALHRKVLILAPLFCIIIAFILASISHLVFWRAMAYLAVYHFIKQQYGFLALYRGKFRVRIENKIFDDKKVIYFSMLYPVIYWHLNYDRQFQWFVKGDFINLRYWLGDWSMLTNICNILYWIVIAGWLIEEIYRHKKQQHPLPTGKILWLLTTAANWYIGIVYFNSDIVFSVTNVIAHGVPYMALIFFYVERKKVIKRGIEIPYGTIILHILMMVLIVLCLAYGEEYLNDMLLNREKSAIFEFLFSYPLAVIDNWWLEALALAILAVPQVTHYIVDGFIWRGNEKNPYLKKVLL